MRGRWESRNGIWTEGRKRKKGNVKVEGGGEEESKKKGARWEIAAGRKRS